MGATTFSDPASTYWRRRFFVLVAGLMVFSMAIWGLSDALAVGRSRIVHGSPPAPSSLAPVPSPSPNPEPQP